MMTRIIRLSTRQSLAVFLVLTGSSIFCQVPAAAVPGSILSEDATSISGAIVSYHRASRYRAVKRDALHPVSWELADRAVNDRVSAGIDGSFALTALPDGAYLVCVDVPAGGYLDPCLWSRGIALKVSLRQAVPLGHIVLKKGAVLRVRINDANHLLPPASLISSSKLIIGIKTSVGAFYPARLVSADQTGRDLMITVPFDAPLKFWIFSRQVKMTDPAGAVVDTSGIDIPFSVAAGTVPLPRVFNVTGTK